MSKKNGNGEGNGNTIVEFDALELEEGAEASPSKLNEMLELVKAKLEPADYAKVEELLGIEGDISNTELLEAFTKLMKGLKGEEEEEEEPEKDAADYKTFIKECMGEGKDLKTCSAEFKEKYPDPDKQPSKEEISEVEQIVAADIEQAGKKKKKGDE